MLKYLLIGLCILSIVVLSGCVQTSGAASKDMGTSPVSDNEISDVESSSSDASGFMNEAQPEDINPEVDIT
jgi:outer membrane lipoprotein-sorting protein